MPGQVPIRNGIFSNAPDFDNQGVSGITGSGVFRSFSYEAHGSTSKTLSSSDLWKIIQFTGNSVLTIPSTGVNPNVGDEVLIINTTGTTAFLPSGSTTLIGTPFIGIAERPIRLIYIGTGAYGNNCWLISGDKTNYLENSVSDCCGNVLNSVYTISSFSTETTAYADNRGTSLYTSTALGGVVVIGGSEYSISSGMVTTNTCNLVNFSISYNVYNTYGTPVTLYSYVYVDLFNPGAIGVPFKTEQVNDVYACNGSFLATGTYYRTYDMYGASNPVCFVNGILTSFTVCP